MHLDIERCCMFAFCCGLGIKTLSSSQFVKDPTFLCDEAASIALQGMMVRNHNTASLFLR
jgi:hypothetical protein